MRIMEEAWDDVNGGELPMGEVRKARGEEIGYMVNREIWSQVPIGMLRFDREGANFGKVGRC